MSKPLKIVSISAEVAPFSKTGGLGDVARSLPKALKRLGQDIVVITPLYGQIIDKEKHGLKLVYENIEVGLDGKDPIRFNFWQGQLMDGLPVYFAENKKYFSKRKSIYGSGHENERFFAFNLAAIQLISLLKFKADIIHCHDWHTGLIPHLIRTNHKSSEIFSKAKTIFTIHNLVFQFGQNWWELPLAKKDAGKKEIPEINDPEIESVNFTKRAILSADAVNTVSEQYKEEIMTKNFGQDLHRILRNRENKLFGIINGIDYNIFNPENDPGLIKNYNYKKSYRKKINKEFLQKIIGLPVDPKIPMIGLTSRVTFQKGFELIIKLLDHLLRKNVQVVIMGDGDKKYINELKKYCKKFPKRIIWMP
ncbi:MAG: glycogen/starch synthase, partial [Patescibacteria group bacterium]